MFEERFHGSCCLLQDLYYVQAKDPERCSMFVHIRADIYVTIAELG